MDVDVIASSQLGLGTHEMAVAAAVVLAAAFSAVRARETLAFALLTITVYGNGGEIRWTVPHDTPARIALHMHAWYPPAPCDMLLVPVHRVLIVACNPML